MSQQYLNMAARRAVSSNVEEIWQKGRQLLMSLASKSHRRGLISVEVVININLVKHKSDVYEETAMLDYGRKKGG